MVIKQPADYVMREVDKLYEKQFEDHETAAIEAHCEFIAEFIRACGWTEEEYIRALNGFESINDKQQN
jgi:hypothetical protein